MPLAHHPRPGLTVDVALLGWGDDQLQGLLIERDREPFVGRWALPGSFVRVDERLDDAARRALASKAHVHDVFLEQLYTFGDVGRDPRERVVSVAWYALVSLAAHAPAPDTSVGRTRDARWFPVTALPPLAFDHAHILDTALTRLRAKVRWAPIGFELLPAAFTLSQLQQLYETILGRSLDKRNFRKKLLALGLVVPLDTFHKGAHRPARHYRFDHERYALTTRDGMVFEI